MAENDTNGNQTCIHKAADLFRRNLLAAIVLILPLILQGHTFLGKVDELISIGLENRTLLRRAVASQGMVDVDDVVPDQTEVSIMLTSMD
jgi:hypothetical protein